MRILAEKLLDKIRIEPKEKRFKTANLLKLNIMLILAALFSAQTATASNFDTLFGYTEQVQEDLGVFPQWVSLIQNDRLSAKDTASCNDRHSGRHCDSADWQNLLEQLSNQPAAEQLAAVNRFVNRLDYVADQDNYGQADYWAGPGQFLNKGGDCEDYAILKFISLRKLGWSTESMRLVVVQDTQLRQPHAVLAVASGDDILILDNQSRKILSQSALPHYAPVYSLGNSQWWLHLPDPQPGQQLLAAN